MPKNGPKSHIHSREDEALYIIDGQFDVQYGNQKFSTLKTVFIYL